MPRPTSRTQTVPYGEDLDQEIEVTFTLHPGTPAKTYGLPENCYPAEPAEYEIESATLDGDTIELSDEEPADVIEWLSENLDDDEDYDGEADYRYEMSRDDSIMDAY